MKKYKLIEDKKGFTQLVPMVMAVVIVFAIMFVGAFINGQINDSLEDSFPAEASRSVLQNDTLSTMDNISGNWDTGVDLMQVTIIITILAGAIAAIFLFTRFN